MTRGSGVSFDAGGLWSRTGIARVGFASFPSSRHLIGVSEPERVSAVLSAFLDDTGL